MRLVESGSRDSATRFERFSFISSCGFGFIRTSAPIRRLVSSSCLGSFAMSPEDERVVTKFRDKIFHGPDRDLYLHIGFFFFWFNAVEFKITYLMAMVCGEKDFAAFNLLVKGMDASTKVARLKRLCATKKRILGPNLLERLKCYEDKTKKLRDRIGHAPLVAGDNDPENFHHASIDRSLEKAAGSPGIPGLLPTDKIPKLSFFEAGLWLNHLSDDLDAILDCYTPAIILEIENPTSPVRWGEA